MILKTVGGVTKVSDVLVNLVLSCSIVQLRVIERLVESLFIMVSHILDVLAQILDVNRTYRSTYCMPFLPGDIETSRQFTELGPQCGPILLHPVQWVFLQEVLDSHSIVQHLFEVPFGVWSRMIIPQR
jgi:hypothetical protein